jgi:diaminopimelate epimerase
MASKLSFTKMHGAGNDFIVIDALQRPVKMSLALAQRLCDRRFGVGADQILLVEPSRRADFRMRIVNADGSEVEMCGNGIRCVARYVYEKGHAKTTRMSFETKAGLIRPSLEGDQVRVDMGPPILDADKVPTRARGRVMDFPLAKLRPALKSFNRDMARLAMTCVSMGNPHAVIFVPDLDPIPVEAWGPVLERHPFFSRRANVEFVHVENPGQVRVRVWERGAGLTMACGTGACAVVVAGVLTGRLHRAVIVRLPGGDLRVEWAADNRVFMTGPAEFVYEGIVNSKARPGATVSRAPVARPGRARRLYV